MKPVHIVYMKLKGENPNSRMALDLARGTGWSFGKMPVAGAVNYHLSYAAMSGTIDALPNLGFAAYFFHPKKPLGHAERWCGAENRVALRIVTAPMYAEELREFGPTALVTPPLDREKFCFGVRTYNEKPVAGISGRAYGGGRKGQSLLTAAIDTPAGQRFEWRASGVNWPVPTVWYEWEQLQEFYHSIDVLVCTSLVEGIPYPPLEALACGVPVVIPRHVGAMDLLPDIPGIEHFDAGDVDSFTAALERVDLNADRYALRAATERFTPEAWVADHVRAFEAVR